MRDGAAAALNAHEGTGKIVYIILSGGSGRPGPRCAGTWPYSFSTRGRTGQGRTRQGSMYIYNHCIVHNNYVVGLEEAPHQHSGKMKVMEKEMRDDNIRVATGVASQVQVPSRRSPTNDR